MDKFNGGITLGIGDYELKKIIKYDPKFTPEEDKFTAYNYKNISNFKGMRFTASIQCGLMEEEELAELQNALFSHTFTFTSSEFTGAVILEGYSPNLVHANVFGKHYRPTFNISAVALVGGSGGL